MVVTHVVRMHLDVHGGEQRGHGLAEGHHACAVGLHCGEHDVVDDFDLLFAVHAWLRLGDGGLRARDFQPLFFLAKAGFDIADALEVFVELGVVVLRESALEGLGVVEHGIEHAAFLREHGLLLRERCGVLGKETMIGGDGAVLAADGFAAHIPSHREAGTVAARIAGFAAVELERGKSRVQAELRGGDLVGADAVVKALSRLRVTVRAGEPHGAAPVAFVAVFVPEPLHDAEVGLVPREGFEAQRQLVVGTGLLDVGIPCRFGDAPAEAEEDQAFRRRGGRCGCGEAADTMVFI